MKNNKLNNDIIQLSGYIYKNVNNKKLKIIIRILKS
mgnify:FL=1